MYDVCPEVVIVKTTSREVIVTLTGADCHRIGQAEEEIFEEGSLQCREGIQLGGHDVEGFTIQGMLCAGGKVRRDYWRDGQERTKQWMTTKEKHDRDDTIQDIPAALAGCADLGETRLKRTEADVRKLTPDTVLVLRQGVAYVDLLDQGKFAPLCSFVSHWWGEETLQFAASLRKHAESAYPEDPGEMCYYICTFSNSQHCVDLGSDWTVSPFNRALEHVAQCYRQKQEAMFGAVMLFDENCTTLTRIWCIFETWRCHNLKLPFTLYSCEGKLTRTSTSSLAERLRALVSQIDLASTSCSELGDKLMIEKAIREAPGGFLAVFAKLRLQASEEL
ncbi:Slc35a3 [Symbiodinium natans]|uniref:Slc35a3 protein n=1 Tax=Symbiodinium natans TaxID=878477 RepID=A0A812NAC5_9DINO|nr:Slc35a3 [Symbiodinium natans]